MDVNAPLLDFRDFWCVAPAVLLSVWGLVVVAADLARYRRRDAETRRLAVGRLTLVGVGLALASAVTLFWLDALAQSDAPRLERILGPSLGSYFAQTDGLIFVGTLARGLPTDILNILFLLLLGLVVWTSTAYSFTEDVGEYFALLLWATVGMMLLAASEELATLFISLEMMTICLYLATAFEKSRRRSPEAGLKYFIYGSVSSALFLYGLSFVYGLTGTTYFDAIGRVLGRGGHQGLAGNLAGAAALLMMLVGFGFKVAATPFHQWAPDVYEGAPAPVAAWIATGSKIASFVAMLKVFLHALGPWSNPSNELMGPGWLGVVVMIAAATMTYGNFAALAQQNYKRMLAYSSIAHAGYLLVGVAAASVSVDGPAAAGAVLYYLVVYAFANVGAFAVAVWLARDLGRDSIRDLNGLGRESPALAVCIVVLMLSLIGIPPFGGFFGKLYIFMEALRQGPSGTRIVLAWLVALGLFNSVVSAFYYFRVLKAIYLRDPIGAGLKRAPTAVAMPIVASAVVVTVFGIAPGPLVELMKSVAQPMLSASKLDEPNASETASPVAWTLPSRPE
ncbi:NADH-quinone oxidoreductase subunit N [Planctomyces sp. SH-PL62]|uniref:NADH-quinone oxidoreductase subunit N n=1 Tax=Planctomyces sp. SH-PL62 TaxID=1636152 RepID=UPI00078C5E89|nr:NADH-quinone oxidoreductase subunit N [Planctomyces sp. SH-PL62]AMV38909.1 NADH-quinone oxidoreductase subunit N [Planctomyces sp. SH-PL62]